VFLNALHLFIMQVVLMAHVCNINDRAGSYGRITHKICGTWKDTQDF
jgi:hypothetical protein